MCVPSIFIDVKVRNTRVSSPTVGSKLFNAPKMRCKGLLRCGNIQHHLLSPLNHWSAGMAQHFFFTVPLSYAAGREKHLPRLVRSLRYVERQSQNSKCNLFMTLMQNNVLTSSLMLALISKLHLELRACMFAFK